MKTKFILHGGFKPAERQESDLFFREMIKDAPQEAKVLLVYFAKEPDRISKNRGEDIEEFNKVKADKKLSFEVATEESFIEQVKRSDVIYLHGGHTGKLLDSLKKFPNLEELLKGKTVGGDSAGANILAVAFYSFKIGAGKGFGILPIKVICHYLEENRHKLDNIQPELETVFLPEYKFKVFYK